MSIDKGHKSDKGSFGKVASPGEKAILHAKLVEAAELFERELEALDTLNRTKAIKEVSELFDLSPHTLYDFLCSDEWEEDDDTTEAISSL